MSDEAFEYVGDELELFQHATNWKRYFSLVLAPHVRGRVLEVGAGLGGTSSFLMTGHESDWVFMEPDASLAAQIRTRYPEQRLIEGTLEDLDAAELFDTILYIDVLEHIADDREELDRAFAHLAPGGRVIVLSPAFQCLFSPFDESVGHERRYNKALLRDVAGNKPVVALGFLDSLGVLLSFGNKLCLRRSLPTTRQIRFWDRMVIPLSRCVDPLLNRFLGRSIYLVVEKPAQAAT